MAKNLVIVESPAKVKTIKKFLGANYEVLASNGHVRDLPKSRMGIDLENGCEPKYITIRGKGDILAALRKAEKKAEKVYLATDPDREGEAISWHLAEALKLDPKKVKRITFNEITKNAVRESLKHPRSIDMDLVDAQQTRRILDRMVGYTISPVLWDKVKRGLSAGRVQSVALRMIAEREEEINAFIPEEYWTLEVPLAVPQEKKPLVAKLSVKKAVSSREEMDRILTELAGADFVVDEVKTGERARKQPLPFTTSTLQQEAANALNFSTQKTMRVAQQLYEGVDIKGSGTVGLITYLRTDSTRISDEAVAAARAFITEVWGSEYAQEVVTKADDGKKIQDAHEAIRPSDIMRTPQQVKESLTNEQYRLYSLIWKRFVACRMTPARYETTAVQITAAGHRFSVTASSMVFDGFRAVYTESEAEKEENRVIRARLEKGMILQAKEPEAKQHFTQPPAHYTEASLVRALEEKGIGRPSTYAPTITTIIARRYVAKESKNLYLTELGEIVDDIMVAAFPVIVDVNFTANMESLLDSIGEGKTPWKSVVQNFYPDLEEAVNAAEKNLEKITVEDEASDVPCDICGRNLVIKYGPHGKFLACPGFPECRNTKPYLEKIGVACPLCGKDIIVRFSTKGRRYYSCESGVDCEFISWARPATTRCPSCGGYMVIRGNQLVCADKACGCRCPREDEGEEE